MAIPFRLRKTRASYPRAAAWRFTVANTVQVSDSYASSVRAVRNIRRLKGRELRLTLLRPGQRRNKNWLHVSTRVAMSDSFTSPGRGSFKRTWRYWRQA